MNSYGVVFKESKKRNYYSSEEDIKLNTLVVVDTSRGEVLGKVVEVNNKNYSEVIKRIATSDDYDKYLNNLKESAKAYNKCKQLVIDYGLDMHIISASYNLDRSILLFNFTADKRVDFRELAKALASIYHTRIELRQVGARDKAKEIGGIGICGAELCCLRFLKKMDTITMNMAKNQNIALNPSKINGTCGRLLCCLAYEDEAYKEASKSMPKVGDTININGKKGQVLSVNYLTHSAKVLVDEEKIDYVINSKE